MGRLYPRMRERPPEWTTNNASPLLDALYFFFAPCRGLYLDNGPYNFKLIPYRGMPPFIWWPSIGRHAITMLDGPEVLRMSPPSVWAFPAGSCFTICAWLRRRLVNSSWVFRYLNSNSYPGWALHAYGSYVSATVADASGTSVRLDIDTCPAETDAHFAAVIKRDESISGWKNGKLVASTVLPSLGSLEHSYFVAIGNVPWGSSGDVWRGPITDVMLWRRELSEAEIAALADPANVDLRVGGVPLILPPRRRFWPVAEAPPAVQIFSRRQFGPRIGTRQVQV